MTQQERASPSNVLLDTPFLHLYLFLSFVIKNLNMGLSKLISWVFRSLFIIMIVMNYIYVVFFTWHPRTYKTGFEYIFLFFFHLLFLMVIWTLFVIQYSDPGQVPLYWGFYFGDSDSKRRRYCLMCNVFKPDRCHHCSICNRCILNMDHHCPWINNCIGFFNRKYFMQMLLYLNLILLLILVSNLKFTVEIMMRIIGNRANIKYELTYGLGYIFVYAADLTMHIVLLLFYKFHIMMMLENKTTIETIDKKGEYFDSPYDKGRQENFLQVMGTNKLLWFLPLKMYLGNPKGNGIDWTEPLLFEEKKISQNPSNSNYTSKASVEPQKGIAIQGNKKQLEVSGSLSSLYDNKKVKSPMNAENVPKAGAADKSNINLQLKAGPTEISQKVIEKKPIAKEHMSANTSVISQASSQIELGATTARSNTPLQNLP